MTAFSLAHTYVKTQKGSQDGYLPLVQFHVVAELYQQLAEATLQTCWVL